MQWRHKMSSSDVADSHQKLGNPIVYVPLVNDGTPQQREEIMDDYHVKNSKLARLKSVFLDKSMPSEIKSEAEKVYNQAREDKESGQGTKACKYVRITNFNRIGRRPRRSTRPRQPRRPRRP